VSVTDSTWTAPIPRDRPTILVADGLLPFLTEHQVVALLHHVTDHFTRGELAFNDYGRSGRAARAMRFADAAARSVAPLLAFGGFGDPAQPEIWEPRLRLVGEESLSRAPDVALFPPVLRLLTRLSAHSATLAQTARILRYRFPRADAV
jgi:O-methyltransferase involved in polyketide biosynthesis